MQKAYLLPLLDKFLREGVAHHDLKVFAEKVDLPAFQILDEVALHIAQEYLGKRLSFDQADLIINNVWGLATALDGHFGETTHTVYLAFDGGEYRRSGDGPDVDPEIKYTRPAINQFLTQRSD